jgi:hypothetical protein
LQRNKSNEVLIKQLGIGIAPYATCNLLLAAQVKSISTAIKNMPKYR